MLVRKSVFFFFSLRFVSTSFPLSFLLFFYFSNLSDFFFLFLGFIIFSVLFFTCSCLFLYIFSLPPFYTFSPSLLLPYSSISSSLLSHPSFFPSFHLSPPLFSFLFYLFPFFSPSLPPPIHPISFHLHPSFIPSHLSLSSFPFISLSSPLSLSSVPLFHTPKFPSNANDTQALPSVSVPDIPSAALPCWC